MSTNVNFTNLVEEYWEEDESEQEIDMEDEVENDEGCLLYTSRCV